VHAVVLHVTPGIVRLPSFSSTSLPFSSLVSPHYPSCYADAISFDSGTALRLLSLETLLEQERRYTDILVQKVLALRPDVLFASRAVSRLAQEMLLKGAVAVVANMKPVNLQRVSRISGARILPSINYIDKIAEHELVGSQATRFLVRTLEVPCAAGTRKTPPQQQDGAHAGADSVSRIAYIVLEGAPPHPVTTVVLRGDARDLAAAKAVLRYALYTGRNLRLQTAFFFDSYIAPPRPFAAGEDAAGDGGWADFMLRRLPTALRSPAGLSHFSSDSLATLARIMISLPSSPWLGLLNPWTSSTPSLSQPRKQLATANAAAAARISAMLIKAFGEQSSRLPLQGGPQALSNLHDFISIPDNLQQQFKALFGDPIDVAESMESLVVSHCLLSDGAQCLKPHKRQFNFYSSSTDYTLGVFLEEQCFDDQQICKACKKGPSAHSIAYFHNKGRVDISIHRLNRAVPSELITAADIAPSSSAETPGRTKNGSTVGSLPMPVGYQFRGMPPSHQLNTHPLGTDIITSSYCLACRTYVTPPARLSRGSWSLSFGKYLELCFYAQTVSSADSGCPHCPLTHHSRYFWRGKTVAVLKFMPINPSFVVLRDRLQHDSAWVRRRIDVEISTLLQLSTAKATEITSLIRELQSLIGLCERVHAALRGTADIADETQVIGRRNPNDGIAIKRSIAGADTSNSHTPLDTSLVLEHTPKIGIDSTDMDSEAAAQGASDMALLPAGERVPLSSLDSTKDNRHSSDISSLMSTELQVPPSDKSLADVIERNQIPPPVRMQNGSIMPSFPPRSSLSETDASAQLDQGDGASNRLRLPSSDAVISELRQISAQLSRHISAMVFMQTELNEALKNVLLSHGLVSTLPIGTSQQESSSSTVPQSPALSLNPSAVEAGRNQLPAPCTDLLSIATLRRDWLSDVRVLEESLTGFPEVVQKHALTLAAVATLDAGKPYYGRRPSLTSLSTTAGIPNEASRAGGLLLSTVGSHSDPCDRDNGLVGSVGDPRVHVPSSDRAPQTLGSDASNSADPISALAQLKAVLQKPSETFLASRAVGIRKSNAFFRNPAVSRSMDVAALISDGHLSLPPGIQNTVVPISASIKSTIVAYSLSADLYWQTLQECVCTAYRHLYGTDAPSMASEELDPIAGLDDSAAQSPNISTDFIGTDLDCDMISEEDREFAELALEEECDEDDEHGARDKFDEVSDNLYDIPEVETCASESNEGTGKKNGILGRKSRQARGEDAVASEQSADSHKDDVLEMGDGVGDATTGAPDASSRRTMRKSLSIRRQAFLSPAAPDGGKQSVLAAIGYPHAVASSSNEAGRRISTSYARAKISFTSPAGAARPGAKSLRHHVVSPLERALSPSFAAEASTHGRTAFADLSPAALSATPLPKRISPVAVSADILAARTPASHRVYPGSHSRLNARPTLESSAGTPQVEALPFRRHSIGSPDGISIIREQKFAVLSPGIAIGLDGPRDSAGRIVQEATASLTAVSALGYDLAALHRGDLPYVESSTGHAIAMARSITNDILPQPLAISRKLGGMESIHSMQKPPLASAFKALVSPSSRVLRKQNYNLPMTDTFFAEDTRPLATPIAMSKRDSAGSHQSSMLSSSAYRTARATPRAALQSNFLTSHAGDLHTLRYKLPPPPQTHGSGMRHRTPSLRSLPRQAGEDSWNEPQVVCDLTSFRKVAGAADELSYSRRSIAETDERRATGTGPSLLETASSPFSMDEAEEVLMEAQRHAEEAVAAQFSRKSPSSASVSLPHGRDDDDADLRRQSRKEGLNDEPKTGKEQRSPSTADEHVSGMAPITVTASKHSSASVTALFSFPTPHGAKRDSFAETLPSAVAPIGAASPFVGKTPARRRNGTVDEVLPSMALGSPKEVSRLRQPTFTRDEANGTFPDVGATPPSSNAGGFGIPLPLTAAEMLLSDVKSDIVHTFADKSEESPAFFCVTSVWAMHFHALRELYLGSQRTFVQSLAWSEPWEASGGKSGARFERTHDRRFVAKHISKTEFDMFNTYIAPGYFKRMRSAFVENKGTLLAKILGAYKVVTQDRMSGWNAALSSLSGLQQVQFAPNVGGFTRKETNYVIIMEDIFFCRTISPGLKFDLKGKPRAQKKEKGPQVIPPVPTTSFTGNNVLPSPAAPTPSGTHPAPFALPAASVADTTPLPLDEGARRIPDRTAVADPTGEPHAVPHDSAMQEQAPESSRSKGTPSIDEAEFTLFQRRRSQDPLCRASGSEGPVHADAQGAGEEKPGNVDHEPDARNDKSSSTPASEFMAASGMSLSRVLPTGAGDSVDTGLSPLPSNAAITRGLSNGVAIGNAAPSTSGTLTAPEGNSLVLLDGDFMALTKGYPWPLTDESKTLLDSVLRADTEFLCSIEVVDYSLLVGIEQETGELVVGVIDYIRRFDFAKKLESRMKTMTALATNVEPTVVQPERYMERLLQAVEKYFVGVPTKASRG
jgi:hypothetical protein